jgi:hypothetical protein
LENRSYLGEFEAEFKKALARESGAQGYCLMKKTEGQKSQETVLLILKKILIKNGSQNILRKNFGYRCFQ